MRREREMERDSYSGKEVAHPRTLLSPVAEYHRRTGEQASCVHVCGQDERSLNGGERERDTRGENGADKPSELREKHGRSPNIRPGDTPYLKATK